MKRQYHFIILSFLIILSSCSKEDAHVSIDSTTESQREISIIPIENALESLDDFLIEINGSATKSILTEKIASIETHFSDRLLTRSGDSMPDAYLVNFDNDAGYAILGANTRMSPVIAYIEEGNNCWESIINPVDEPRSEFEDEILNSGIAPEKLLSMCIHSALNGAKDDKVETKAEIFRTDIGPLTSNQLFNQHVTYCHKPNGGYVLNGCASTALGIIIAYNNYPHISCDYEMLDYSNCNLFDGNAIKYRFGKKDLFLPLDDYYKNSSSIPPLGALTNDQKIALLTNFDKNIIKNHGTPTKIEYSAFTRTRYKITSAIFYLTDNIVLGWTGTGALPLAIAAGLRNLGYTDVHQYQTKTLNTKQLDRIVEMLDLGKPVLMCGWELTSLETSHYWVVDGVAISNRRSLIHCNWGWGGSCNGWFSTDCVNSSSPETKSSGTANEWANLIVYTYNMNATAPNKYTHKVFDMMQEY